MQTAGNNVTYPNLRGPLQPLTRYQPRSTRNSQHQGTRPTQRNILPLVFDINELIRLINPDPADKENDHPNHP